MKIVIDENQYKKLTEQNIIGYTPERIDAFIQEGLEHIQKFTKVYNKYYHDLYLVKVGDVFQNLEQYKILIDKMEKHIDYLENLSNKYYRIIDMYEIGEYPENVTKLEDVYNDIDNLKEEIDDIKDIYQALYDAIEHYIKWDSKIGNRLTDKDTINI